MEADYKKALEGRTIERVENHAGRLGLFFTDGSVLDVSIYGLGESLMLELIEEER
jgi:hypothetical protein